MQLLADDNCSYDSDGNGSRGRNWAMDWQNSHTEDVDWWQSGAAHSQHLNGNLKGFAAWWLWATLGGWNQCLPGPSALEAAADSVALEVQLNWVDNSSEEDNFIIQRREISGSWDNNYAVVTADTTTFTDTGLTAGTFYYRVVAHLNDDGTGDPCDSVASNVQWGEIISNDPPEAPSELNIVANSQTRVISLSWTDTSGNEDGFVIQRRFNLQTWEDFVPNIAPNVTTYNDLNLAPGNYSYRVYAYNVFGDSDPSNEDSGSILNIPQAPSSLTATGDSMAGSVSLIWNDNSDSEDEFIIQRQVDGGPLDTDYDLVPVNITEYLDDNYGTGLSSGTYTYQIVASNMDGDSNPSNQSSAVITQTILITPSDLSSNLSGFDVILTWTDNSDNEENIILERKMDTGSYMVLATLATDTETYADNGLVPLHTYTYRIMAVNNFGGSAYSNETSEYIAEESVSITLKHDVNEYTGCRDAYLRSDSPTYNSGGDPYDYVQNNPKENMIISFDMPDETMGKKILEARLGVYCWSVSSYEENQYLDLYKVLEEWEEGSATNTFQEGSVSWNVRQGSDSWLTPGGTHSTLPQDRFLIPSTSHYPEFDITELVQEWVNGISPNYGVIIKNDTPVSTGIKASEYSEYDRPYLEITYTNACPDFDGDGDVDGTDLALFAADYNENCLGMFADAFGF